MEQQKQLLDISWETILKVAIAAFTFYLLYLIRDIVIWFIFALIISVLLNPLIVFLRKLRVPRILATVFVYLVIFGIFGLVIYLTIPIFITEFQQFYNSIPQYFKRISPFFEEIGIEAFKNLESFVRVVIIKLQESSSGIFGALSLLFGGISSTIFILTIAFFLSLEENWIERVLLLFSPKKYEESVLVIFKRCQNKVTGWFGVRVLACLFVGVASFIIFSLFKIKYSFILALLAGALNFIPYLGPLVTAVLLFLFVGVTDTWIKSLIVLAGFFAVQYIEGSILSPILTKKFLGLPPVLVLLSLVIGGKIFGILGAIFAIPVAGITYEFLKDFLKRRKEIL